MTENPCSSARQGLRMRRWVLGIVLSLSAGSMMVTSSPGRADSGTCTASKCSVSVGVRFTIHIPASLSMRRLGTNPLRRVAARRGDWAARDREGVIFLTNLRQPVRYTVGADGVVTASVP